MELRLETRISITKALLKILKKTQKTHEGGEGWGVVRQWRMAAKVTEL